MTNEEAKEMLHNERVEIFYRYPAMNEALNHAISALEKQIPKKPNVYNKFERHCECGAIVKTYQNYCNDCGQALDWSDDE